jgi:hypothetical protein
MSILPRESSGRRDSVGGGIWFLALGAVVGGLSLLTSGAPLSRVTGALLACVLVIRGVARIRQARRSSHAESVSVSVNVRVGHLGDERPKTSSAP